MEAVGAKTGDYAGAESSESRESSETQAQCSSETRNLTTYAHGFTQIEREVGREIGAVYCSRFTDSLSAQLPVYAGYSGYVGLGFAVWWDSAVFADGAGAGVVGGQRQGQMIPCQIRPFAATG